MLDQLIKHESIVDFCDAIKFYNLNQYAKLCGVDYFMENTAFKIYVELKEIPTKEQCKRFLQDDKTIELFMQNLSYWKPERESSLAFGIKIDNNFHVRTYFHIKFDENYLFEDPNVSLLTRFKLIGIDFNKKLKGMSVEYNLNTNKLLTKNYYYVTNKIEMLKIVGFENIKKESFNIDDLEELEIYTTPLMYKINVVKKYMHEDAMNSRHLVIPKLQEPEIYKLIPIDYHEKVKKDSEILEVPPYFVGLTSDKKRISVYFSFTKKENNILGL